MNSRIIQLGSRWRLLQASDALRTGSSTRYPLNRNWADLTAKHDAERKKFLPCLKSNPRHPFRHCDDSINITWLDTDAKFLRRFLKPTRRVSLMYWTCLNTIMKSSVFMGFKNPLSWLQQPVVGSCLEPEEFSLHSHTPPLFSKILCNDVSQLKI